MVSRLNKQLAWSSKSLTWSSTIGIAQCIYACIRYICRVPAKSMFLSPFFPHVFRILVLWKGDVTGTQDHYPFGKGQAFVLRNEREIKLVNRI